MGCKGRPGVKKIENNYLAFVDLFGKETWMYTACEYQKMLDGKVATFVEIPFLINMGWSFFITVAVMGIISMAGPKVNPKAFEIDSSMFKLKPVAIAMVVATLLILTMIYVRFW